MQAVINISPDAIRAVYFDGIADCFTDCPMEIRRASQVEFNGARQQWEVRLADASGSFDPIKVDYAAASRAECIQWEIGELNRRFIEQ